MTYIQTHDSFAERLAIGLGMFSIAIGVAELLAPDRVARLIGTAPGDRARTLIRSFGAREIAAGVAILQQPEHARWLWSRVAGDSVDLASLAGVLGSPTAQRTKTLGAAAAVVGVTLLDIIAATQLSAQGRLVREAITVNRPIEEVEAAWARHFDGEGASIRFQHAPGARGTEVIIETSAMRESVLRQEMRRVKQILETGEVVLSDGPGLKRPARPQPRVEEQILAGARS